MKEKHCVHRPHPTKKSKTFCDPATFVLVCVFLKGCTHCSTNHCNGHRKEQAKAKAIFDVKNYRILNRLYMNMKKTKMLWFENNNHKTDVNSDYLISIDDITLTSL